MLGYSVHVPDAYLVGGDGSRAIRAVSDGGAGGAVLLAAPGARGTFSPVPLPEGWTAPRVCAWSPPGGVLGGVAGDTSCVLAVGSGSRALLCARAAALRACLAAGLPGPAGGAWEPTDAPVHTTWVVLPLDVSAGEGAGAAGDAFTSLAWAPRLYRHAAGARSYLALGSAGGELQLLRLSSFSQELWPSEQPPPCAGDLGSGAVEGLVVARVRPAGGGRGLASLAWVGRKSIALGWGDGAVCLATVEGRVGPSNNWDSGAVVSPALRVLPPNGAPAVALRYEAGCLAAARGQALSFAWPAGGGGGSGGEGGDGSGGGAAGRQPPGARPRWRVTEEPTLPGGRALTIENAHDGAVTGVHLVSLPGAGGAVVAYTCSLDGSVRSWAARGALGWLPGGPRPPLMRLVDAGAGGAGSALAWGCEAGAPPPPPPSLRASPLYGLTGDAGALALEVLTCAPAAHRVHANPARTKRASASAADGTHAPERCLLPLAISLLPFPPAVRLAGAVPEAGGVSFGAVGEALALALGALEGCAARVGKAVAQEGPGALLCPPGPDDAGDRDATALACALERYGDAAAAAARAWAASYTSAAWVRKPGRGAPACVGDLQAEAEAWLAHRDGGGSGAGGGGGVAALEGGGGGGGEGNAAASPEDAGAAAAPPEGAGAAAAGAAPEGGGGGAATALGNGGEAVFFRPVFAAERRNPGAPAKGIQWVPRPLSEGLACERAEWYAPFSPAHLFSAARGGCSPPAAAATRALLDAQRAAACGAPLHASLQALLPLFVLGCAGAAQAAPRGGAPTHLRTALRTCQHVLHAALEALLARHGPPLGGGAGGGEGEPGGAGGGGAAAALPSAALPGGDALPGVAFLGARRRLARAPPSLPPRWAWYAASVAPRLHLWLRCEELRLVSGEPHTRCEANNDAWKAAIAVALAAVGAREEGGERPLLEPALLSDLLAWSPVAAAAPQGGAAPGWAEPLPALPLMRADTWIAPEVSLSTPPSFLLAQALEVCGGVLAPRW
jgi:hypothetical protein